MKQEAARMIVGMFAIAGFISLGGGGLMVFAIVGAVGYVLWAVAEGLE